MAVLPSPTNIANAYRSELTGIYASLAMVLTVTTLHKVASSRLLVGCDNEKGLYLSSLINDRVSPKQKHSDILRTIRHVRGKLPIDITFKHISGHQDETTLYELLDRPSQLNIDCDLLAKAGLRRFHKEKLVPPDALPHEEILIRIKGEKITGDIGPPLRNEVSRVKMRTFLDVKGTLSAEAFNTVD